MRSGTLIVGIVLVIFGLFLYFSGNNMIQEVEAYDVEGIPISEILKLVSKDAQRQYETGQSMIMFGTIFFVVGFIVCIAGLVAPSKKSITANGSKKELKLPIIGNAVKDFKDKNQGISRVECEICGNLYNHDVLHLFEVNGNDKLLCKGCADKFSDDEKKNSEISEEKAIEILKIRYAKGEVTKKEYEEMKKDLES